MVEEILGALPTLIKIIPGLDAVLRHLLGSAFVGATEKDLHVRDRVNEILGGSRRQLQETLLELERKKQKRAEMATEDAAAQEEPLG